MVVTGNLLARVVAYAAKHYPDDDSNENRIAQQSYLDGYQAAYNINCQEWLEYARMIQQDAKWIKWNQAGAIFLLGMLIRGWM